VHDRDSPKAARDVASVHFRPSITRTDMDMIVEAAEVYSTRLVGVQFQSVEAHPLADDVDK